MFKFLKNILVKKTKYIKLYYQLKNLYLFKIKIIN